MITPSTSLSIVALRMLRAAGVAGESTDCLLRLMPSNPERRDYARRRIYRVLLDEKPAAIATVGPDLAGLRERTDLVARALPDIACKVIAFEKSPEGDVLLTEFFAGVPVTHSDLPIEEVLSVLKHIDARFGAALAPSTSVAAQEELRILFQEVLELPYWTRADRAFLTGVVFPVTEEQLIPVEPRRRVSNGDFVLQNILVGPDRSIRIIDCEFGANTHFHEEDWLRLIYWTSVPEAVREFASARILRPKGTKLYLALKQLTTEHAVSLPQKAQAEARAWCDEIRRLLQVSTTEMRQSLLWPTEADSFADEIVSAELLWMTDDGWDASRSLRVAAPFNRAFRLNFSIPPGPACHGLRFDPGDRPGVITIHSLLIETWMPGTKQRIVSFSAANAIGLTRFQAAGDAFVSSEPDSECFEIVSTGNDPQLYLLELGAPAGHGIEIEIIATFSANPVAQLHGLRQYVKTLNQRAARVKQEAQLSLARLEEADRIKGAALASTREFSDRVATLQTVIWEAIANTNRAIVQEFESTRSSVLAQGRELLERLANNDSVLHDLGTAFGSDLIASTAAQRTATEHLAAGIQQLAQSLAASHEDIAREVSASSERIASDQQTAWLALNETIRRRDEETGVWRIAIGSELQAGFRGLGTLLHELQQVSRIANTILDATRLATNSQTVTIERLTTELEAAGTKRERVATELQLLTSRHASTQTRAEAAERKVDEFLHFLEGHARTIDRLEQALGHQTREITTITTDLSRTRERLAAAEGTGRELEVSLAQERAFRTMVEMSMSWRWGARLRRLLAWIWRGNR